MSFAVTAALMALAVTATLVTAAVPILMMITMYFRIVA